MKTLCFLSALLLFILNPIASQIRLLPPVESQPVWTVEGFISGFSQGVWRYWYGSEAQLCDHNWQIVYAQRDCEPAQLLGYYREEGLKGWFRTTRRCEDYTHLLFDFALEVRDTFHFIPIGGGAGPPTVPWTSNFFTVLSKEQMPDGSIEMGLWNHAHGEGLTWRTGLGADSDPFRMFDLCQLGGSCHYHSYFHCLNFLGPIPEISGGYFRVDTDCELSHGSGRIYVDVHAGGSATGYDWENALPDLQLALAQASCGTEIWVAQGTYYPADANERTASFQIPNGVRIYGGFEGTEAFLNERDFENNLTLLSGEIGDSSSLTDNSYHVVTFLGTDTTTVLDGFTISGGYAIATPNSDAPVGGGILVNTDEAHPLTECRIENCRIINNTAAGGGGVACIGVARPDEDWRAYPRLKNCEIVNNYATANGGGLYFRWMGHPREGIPLLENCAVQGNRADIHGGGLYLDDPNENIFLKNVHFSLDSANLDGGAVAGYQNIGRNPALVFDSCVFEKNYTKTGGGLSFVSLLSSTYPNPLTKIALKECTIKENTAITEGGGLCFTFSGSSYFDVEISNTEFIRNNLTRGNNGAGFYLLFDNDAVGNIDINKTRIIENTHSFPEDGRATVFVGATFSNAQITSRFTNCVFANNVMGLGLSSGIGGAIQENTIANCIFYNNGPRPCVTSWNPDEPSQNHTLFYNNIVWEPEVEHPVLSGFTSLNSVTLHHNLVSSLDCSLPGGDIACGAGNIIGFDPIFLDAANGDFRTATCSPARNSGSMAAINELGLLTDLGGHARLLGGRIDMGAYEQAAERWQLGDPIPVSCFGAADGQIPLDTLNAVLPIEVNWESPNETGNSLDNLPGGPLEVQLTDALGCRDTFRFTIVEPTPIQFSSTINNASTAQRADGSISVFNIVGGQAHYRYSWSTGDTTATISNIPAGDYTLSITDSQNCTVEHTFTVNFTTGLSEVLVEHGVQLFPNPVGNHQLFQLHIAKAFANPVEVRLMTLQGQLINTYRLSKGQTTLTIPAPELAGIYYLVLSDAATEVLGGLKLIRKR